MKDDFRDRSHLTIHDGERPEDKPRTWRRKSMEGAEQVTCWQCLADVGIETSAVVEMTAAPRRRPDGKKTGGTKSWVCVYCLTRGKITKLI